MPHKFLITGLPRSRTAWLSAIFCTDNIICFHEPINQLGDIQAVKDFVSKVQGYSHVGISDSSIGANPSEYIDYFFSYPIVVIKRPKVEVVESLIKFLGIQRKEANQIVSTISEGLKYISCVRSVFEVEYEALNDSNVVAEIWDYVTRGLPFDKNRCINFQNLMINQHATKVISEMGINENIRKFKN